MTIPQKNLEGKVCQIFKDNGVAIDKIDIDGCRLQDNEKAIIKFRRCKNCKQVLRYKKDIRNINLTNLYLPERTTLFINESLYPYYKGLWVNCKKLQRRNQIHSFFIAKGSLKFCFKEHGPVNIVTHQQDLKDLFLDVDSETL